MPNRMLRDWTQSDKVDQLSCQAERFFTRLIMKVDDYGCFYADTRLLKANLFPLKIDKIREADISRWTAECQKAGLIVLYLAVNKKYLQILDFKQRLDKAKAKFPLPNDSVEIVNDFPPEVEEEVETEIEGEKKGAASPDDRFEKKLILENPFSEKFLMTWIMWKDFKKNHFKFLFRSIESEQIAINDLAKKSDFNEEKAIEIINQSIANGWKGLFEVKNKKNGTHQQTVNGYSKPKTGTSDARIEAAKNF